MSRSDSIVWECPACGSRVTTLIPMRYAPLCIRHAKGGRTMVQVSQKRPK